MKRTCIGVVMLLLAASVAWGQAKPADPPKDDPPVLTADLKAQIAMAERDAMADQAQKTQLNDKYQQLSKQIDDKSARDQKRLQDLLDSAKIPGYVLSPDTLLYGANPKPAVSNDPNPTPMACVTKDGKPCTTPAQAAAPPAKKPTKPSAPKKP